MMMIAPSSLCVLNKLATGVDDGRERMREPHISDSSCVGEQEGGGRECQKKMKDTIRGISHLTAVVFSSFHQSAAEQRNRNNEKIIIFSSAMSFGEKRQQQEIFPGDDKTR